MANIDPNDLHVITQEDLDEKATMAPPYLTAPDAKNLKSPPKKLVQINFFREVVAESLSPPNKTVSVAEHSRNGKMIAKHTRNVKTTPSKLAKKSGISMKTSGKYDHFDGDKATAKLVAAIKFQDTIDRVARIKATHNK